MITRKSLREIRLLQQAGQIVAKTFRLLEQMVAPGVKTKLLDDEAEKFIRSQGAIPIFKGYRGFPASICASVNEEIVHGIPNNRQLVSGDIISIDIGVRYQGYVGDAAKTFPVGDISPEATALLKVCEECLHFGIESSKAGNKISDIGKAVQSHAEKHGYSVVRDYTGHGIGTDMHEDPQVPNFVDKNWPALDCAIKPGYCLAIEPMINMGTYLTKTVRRQNWDVVVTRDKKLSAHFEHSIAVLENKVIILTVEEPVALNT